jgi:hypothetical protein
LSFELGELRRKKVRSEVHFGWLSCTRVASSRIAKWTNDGVANVIKFNNWSSCNNMKSLDLFLFSYQVLNNFECFFFSFNRFKHNKPITDRCNSDFILFYFLFLLEHSWKSLIRSTYEIYIGAFRSLLQKTRGVQLNSNVFGFLALTNAFVGLINPVIYMLIRLNLFKYHVLFLFRFYVSRFCITQFII